MRRHFHKWHSLRSCGKCRPGLRDCHSALHFLDKFRTKGRHNFTDTQLTFSQHILSLLFFFSFVFIILLFFCVHYTTNKDWFWTTLINWASLALEEDGWMNG